MDVTKKLFKNIPEHLLYFAASNLIAAFAALFFNLLLRPIVTELARGDAEKEAMISDGFSVIFVLLFFVVMAVLLFKSGGMKNRYLSETIGREYHFASDLSSFARGGYPAGVAAYLLFTLPFTVVMVIFPDLPYLPFFFYPQDALIDLCQNAFVAWIVGGVAYAIFSLVYFPILHAIWEKNRIYRG